MPPEPDPFEKLKAELEAMDPEDPDVVRLRELAENPVVSANAPRIDDASLEAIEARAMAARERLIASREAEERRLGQDRDASRGLGVGLSIAYPLIGLPLAGAGIGHLLNERTGWLGWQPILVITGSMIGIWFAVMQINRANKKP